LGTREKPSAEAAREGMPEISLNLKLHIQLLKLTTLITQPMRDCVAKPHDLTIEDIKILICLIDHETLTGAEISELVAISPISASRSIASMIEKGWVKLRFDPNDRRRRPVVLTPKGLSVYRSLIPSMAGVADQLYAPFSDREKDFLHAAIKVILDSGIIHDS